MAEKQTRRIDINYRTIDQSLTILERNAKLNRILEGTRLAIVFSGSPYDGGIFSVGAATAFTIERAYANWFAKDEAPGISFFTTGATVKALLKISDVVGTDIGLGGGADYTKLYQEVIKAVKGDGFLGQVESTRHQLFPALNPAVFYLGATDLSLILGFEKANRERKLKEKYQEVVTLPALNPYSK